MVCGATVVAVLMILAGARGASAISLGGGVSLGAGILPPPHGIATPGHGLPEPPATVSPGHAIFSVRIGGRAAYWVSRWNAVEVAPHVIAVTFDFTFGSLVVRAHTSRTGLIDALSTASRHLVLYGKPLSLGFDRLSARLKRLGWRVRACSNGVGHLAAFGGFGQRQTYVVWSSNDVAVAIGGADSSFVRSAASCATIA